MKLISWNVNGFRAVLGKGFGDFFAAADADIFCIQETKMQPFQADFEPQGYRVYYNSAVRKGYSGTGLFVKNEPLDVKYGLKGEHNDEGRVITAEYKDFYFVGCYVPNAQSELKRIGYRVEFEEAMRSYLTELDADKPVIYCGDLNVAHKEIDLTNPKQNVGNPGFSDEERDCFGKLLDAGFVDTFRCLYPHKEGAYTWWSYRTRGRERNVGWRIDYFVVSARLEDKIKDVIIHNEVYGSDHCPIELDIDI